MRATLTQTQLQRLGQITLQLHGPMAFGQAEIAERLHLKDAQRQAIRQIQMEAFASAWDFMNPGSGMFAIGERRKDFPMPDGNGHGTPPAGGYRATILQGVMEKVFAVLTPEQVAQWKTLTGPPFEDIAEFLPVSFEAFAAMVREHPPTMSPFGMPMPGMPGGVQPPFGPGGPAAGLMPNGPLGLQPGGPRGKEGTQPEGTVHENGQGQKTEGREAH
jgi:hypothetical protein